MVRYSDELIEDIKSKNDIIDIISQYVILKRSGRNFFGLCPFHKEKSPSFSVSPDKQIFHCFGCGVGGNVMHFIQKIENINFPEAIELLAERAGIEIPTLDTVDTMTAFSSVAVRSLFLPARSEKYGEYQVLSITVSAVLDSVLSLVMLPRVSILHSSPVSVT